MLKDFINNTSRKQKFVTGGGILLVILEIIFIYLAIVSYNNKNLNKYIFGSKDLKNTELFAVMVEDNNGDYKQQSTFPDFPYQFNITKSNCIDNEGNTIKDSLLFDEEKREVIVKTNKTAGCYLFFNKPKEAFATSLINSGELWQSGLEGDGYRYVGTGITCSYDEGNYIGVADNQYTTPSCPTLYNYTRTKISDGSTTDYTYKTSCPSDTSTYTYSCTELTGTLDSSNVPDNFICFGVSDKTECKNNEAKYLYRIIGVFEGSDGNQHLKLISLKQLSSTYAWNANYTSDVSWENSDMYAGLNGSYFLASGTYDYLQNSTWLNKIENWTWSAVNTKAYSDSGPYYYSITTQEMYLHEMNRSSKTSTIGEWTTPVAKIGLMYASDYQMSLGSSSLSYTGSSNAATLKTGWLHQSNNDTTSSTYEWTLSRSGVGDGGFSAMLVDSVGDVSNDGVISPHGARPVFFLTSDVEKQSGKGTYNEPYILRETNENKLKVSTSLSGSTMTVNITKGDYELNKYCINNSPFITGCTWNKVTSTTITTEVNEGYTYIHVVDKGGYLVHGSVYELPNLSQFLIDNAGLWQSGLEGDGYRYVGSGSYDSETTPDNFICFGTSDKTECKNNEAKYMYRIIGVFEGSDGEQHLKLISLKQLGGRYEWHSSNSDVDWNSSTLYTGLNGEYFLTNTTYDYMQNSTWLNKIEDWTWSAVNTLTNASNGPDYYDGLAPSEIYLHEMNRSGKTSTIGEWSTPVAKIGLMYVSDYILSLGDSALAITGGAFTNEATLVTGWMHFSNNGITDYEVNCFEWTLSRYGDSGGRFFAWSVYLDGYVGHDFVNDIFGVRPVFHLTSDVKYKSGSGTYSDPYIINE